MKMGGGGGWRGCRYVSLRKNNEFFRIFFAVYTRGYVSFNFRYFQRNSFEAIGRLPVSKDRYYIVDTHRRILLSQ